VPSARFEQVLSPIQSALAMIVNPGDSNSTRSSIDKVLGVLMGASISTTVFRTSDNLWTTGHMVGLVVFIVLLMKLKKDQMERKAARDAVPGFPSARGAHWFCGHTILIRKANFGGEGYLEGYKKVYTDAADPKSGASSLWFFNISSISVLQAQDVKKILQSTSYRKSNGFVDAHVHNLLGRRNLISLVGKDWRAFRNAVHKSFTQASVIQSQETMHEVGNTMAESLLQEIRIQKNENSVTREILPLMKCATVDAFGLAILDGFDFKCSQLLELQSLAVSFECLISEFVRRFQRPWDPTTFLYGIPTASNREYERHRTHVRTFIRKQIAQARERIQEEERIDDINNNINSKQIKNNNCIPKRSSELTTNLVRAAAEMEAGNHGNDSCDTKLVEETLEDVYLTLLFGAYETASITMTYALYILATHPQVQENCVEEIETVMKKKRTTNRSETSADDDELKVQNADVGVHDLPYTKAVVMEAMRLFPPAPVTRRNLEKPLRLPSNGKVLPKGQMVNVSIWSVQRSEFNFPRPDDMIPERWVRRRRKKIQIDGDDDGGIENIGDKDAKDARSKYTSAWEERDPNDDRDSNAIIAPANRDAFCAFAAGARNCVGKIFAVQESVIILACLVKELKFDVVSPDYKPRPMISGFVQRPDDNLPMSIRARNV